MITKTKSDEDRRALALSVRENEILRKALQLVLKKAMKEGKLEGKFLYDRKSLLCMASEYLEVNK